MPALFFKKEKGEEFLKFRKVVEEFLNKNKENNSLVIEAGNGMNEIIDEEGERGKLSAKYVSPPNFITGLVREKKVKYSSAVNSLGLDDSPSKDDRTVRFILDYDKSVYIFEGHNREEFQNLVDSILVGERYEFECRKNRIGLGEIMRISQKLPSA